MKKTILGIIIVIILLLSAGYVYFLYLQKNNSVNQLENNLNKTASNNHDDIKQKDGSEEFENNVDNTFKNEIDLIAQIKTCQDLKNITGINFDEGFTEGINLYKEDVFKKSNIEVTYEELCALMLFGYYQINMMSSGISIDEANFEEEISKFSKKYNIDTATSKIVSDVTEYSLLAVKKKMLNTELEAAISIPVVEASLCMKDDPGYINEQIPGNKICKDGVGIWTDISALGAEWGGCNLAVKRNEQGRIVKFEYCATLTDGHVVHCNESGCDFD